MTGHLDAPAEKISGCFSDGWYGRLGEVREFVQGSQQIVRTATLITEPGVYEAHLSANDHDVFLLEIDGPVMIRSVGETDTYALAFLDFDTVLAEDDDSGEGTNFEIVLEDASGPEDGGTYEVIVDAIANADCGRAYLLSIQGD